MLRYAFFANVCDQDVEGETAYRRRFLRSFAGPLWPFGCDIEYRSTNPQIIRRRLRTLGSGFLRGVLVGFEQKPCGDWTQKFHIVDAEDLAAAGRTASRS